MTPWLVLDYGEVISLPYDDAVRSEVAGLLDLEPGVLEDRYWADRISLDAGVPSADYWTRVAGRPVGAEEATTLDEVDIAGWARVDPEMLAMLDEQRAAGVRLALLSNAPHVQADAFEKVGWTKVFERVFVSARIGLTKPSPAIFEHVLAELHAKPQDITFVDDKPANVAAAAALGLRAIQFTGVQDLRRALT